jgi:hypothetical protein
LRRTPRASAGVIVIRHLEALLDCSLKPVTRSDLPAPLRFSFSGLKFLNGHPGGILDDRYASIAGFFFFGLFRFAIAALLAFSHVSPLL